MSAKQLDFVAVGPFKTGTSWIYNYLINYQQVTLPTTVKETFFFDRQFDRGLDWYYSHFELLGEKPKKVGEIAPSYFHSSAATDRIHQLNPNCKILVTFREPLSRLVSFYQHMQQRGEIKPNVTLSQALSQKQILRDTASYYRHLSHWIKVFGRDNVRVVFFETLKASPEQFAVELCENLDLELENTQQDLTKKVNASQAPINHNLAKIVYSGVNFLHSSGLHKIVDYGKNLGIKKLIFSRQAKKFQLEPKEFQSILQLIEDDILQLETKLNFDLSPWKKLWQEQGIEIS